MKRGASSVGLDETGRSAAAQVQGVPDETGRSAAARVQGVPDETIPDAVDGGNDYDSDEEQERIAASLNAEIGDITVIEVDSGGRELSRMHRQAKGLGKGKGKGKPEPDGPAVAGKGEGKGIPQADEPDGLAVAGKGEGKGIPQANGAMQVINMIEDAEGNFTMWVTRVEAPMATSP